ncbi:MAG: hypothetical protein U5K43_03120 [Halofilum sp. (in: g-proteobacteria)]|nr:hypothetical protein [Halofilum sp. (in: g-proteobacteria)]
MHPRIRTRPPVAVLWGAMALAAIAAGLNGLFAQVGAESYARVRGGFGPIQYGTIALAAGIHRRRRPRPRAAAAAHRLPGAGAARAGTRPGRRLPLREPRRLDDPAGRWWSCCAWQQRRPGLRRYAIAAAP